MDHLSPDRRRGRTAPPSRSRAFEDLLRDAEAPDRCVDDVGEARIRKRVIGHCQSPFWFERLSIQLENQTDARTGLCLDLPSWQFEKIDLRV